MIICLLQLNVLTMVWLSLSMMCTFTSFLDDWSVLGGSMGFGASGLENFG
jgi:hypothetical protein